MLGPSRQLKYWFRAEGDASIFFPFGLEGEGYIVKNDERPRIQRWTFWQAQIPAFLLILVVPPAVVFLPPLFTQDARAGWMAVLLMAAFYCAAAQGASWLAARIIYGVLLWDCPRLDRRLTREERHSSTGQIVSRLSGLGAAPLLICLMGLAAALATSLAGLPRHDALMVVVGLVATGCFVLPLLSADADELIERFRTWKMRRRTAHYR